MHEAEWKLDLPYLYFACRDNPEKWGEVRRYLVSVLMPKVAKILGISGDDEALAQTRGLLEKYASMLASHAGATEEPSHRPAPHTAPHAPIAHFEHTGTAPTSTAPSASLRSMRSSQPRMPWQASRSRTSRRGWGQRSAKRTRSAASAASSIQLLARSR